MNSYQEKTQRLKEEIQRLKLQIEEGQEFDRHLKEQLEKNKMLKETEKYKEVENLHQRLKDFIRFVEKKIEEDDVDSIKIPTSWTDKDLDE
jgi:hypothetical protein